MKTKNLLYAQDSRAGALRNTSNITKAIRKSWELATLKIGMPCRFVNYSGPLGKSQAWRMMPMWLGVCPGCKARGRDWPFLTPVLIAPCKAHFESYLDCVRNVYDRFETCNSEYTHKKAGPNNQVRSTQRLTVWQARVEICHALSACVGPATAD